MTLSMTLVVVALAGVANARSLRMPVQRFASLEGLEGALEAEGEAAYCARIPRHLAFAEFDQPLAAEDSPAPLHRRLARGADCSDDDADLQAEFVESAPELEAAEYVSEYAVPAPQQQKGVIFDAPEELPNALLAEIDDPLPDDQEATLSVGGLHPADELTADETASDLGRPAREASPEAEKENEDTAEAPEAAEEVEKKEEPEDAKSSK